MDDGDLAAEAPEHLSELETNVASTEDDEVVRDSVEFHDRFVVQGGDVMDAVDLWDGCAQAGVEEDPVAFESARTTGTEVNLEGFGSDEVREAVDEFEIFGGRQALFVAGAGILDDLALALADFGQVDGNGAGG